MNVFFGGGLSCWRLGSDGFLLRKMGFQEPQDLGGFEGGGAVINGTGFDGIEPLRRFGKAAGGDNAQAGALQGRSLEEVG